MKKAKFLTLALVVAIMMMGAGYAYWSESLKINSRVDTGYLDVAFEPIDECDITVDEEKLITYDNTSIINNKKTAQIRFQNFYPGESATVELTIRNTGTIPVSLDDVDFELLGNDNLKNVMHVWLDGQRSLPEIDLLEQDDVNNIDFRSNGLNKLAPNDTFVFTLKFEMDGEAENNTENTNMTFNITPVFTQFNAPAE